MDEFKMGEDCLVTSGLMKKKRLEDIAEKLYQHNWLFLGRTRIMLRLSPLFQNLD
jgi:hypothetical protein